MAGGKEGRKSTCDEGGLNWVEGGAGTRFFDQMPHRVSSRGKRDDLQRSQSRMHHVTE